ncbi:hypothetical protein [Paenibacillus solanacearum]|uniref:hypothetical protein n=1 Tax=Paenibacillus solanacearum TaxID=2048548 RepID=UPI001C4061D9|nr:hypothetical protein [Paenibacillus solanacearum]
MNTMILFRHAARLLLGITFFIGACNGFLYGSGMQPIMPANPEIIAVFQGSNAWLLMLKTVELACSLLLLSSRLVLPALIALAPIVLGIAVVHATLDPGFLPAAGLIFGLESYLLYIYGKRGIEERQWKREARKHSGKRGIRNIGPF